MPFLLTRTNLEDLKTDAKVIGSCPYRNLSRNSGWQPDLWAEQRRIQALQTGESMVTSGKEFDAKCGIITMVPMWEGGSRKEKLHLAACYDSALRLACKRRCRSISFPLLSGDCNGFPRDLAFRTAVETIGEFLTKHELTVYLSVKDGWTQYLPKLQIPELSAAAAEKRLSTQALFEQMIRGTPAKEETPAQMEEEPIPQPEEKHKTPSPFDFLKPRHPEQTPGEQSFAAGFLKWMEEKDLKEAQVCQKANMERKQFLKLRSGVQPGKVSAYAICVALELTLEETKALLAKAGLSMDPGDVFDGILKHFISRRNYNIYEINSVLFVYEQPLLGVV